MTGMRAVDTAVEVRSGARDGPGSSYVGVAQHSNTARKSRSTVAGATAYGETKTEVKPKWHVMTGTRAEDIGSPPGSSTPAGVTGATEHGASVTRTTGHPRTVPGGAWQKTGMSERT